MRLRTEARKRKNGNAHAVLTARRGESEIIMTREGITAEQFDRKLFEILREIRGIDLISVPGIYEIVSEVFNNEILESFED